MKGVEENSRFRIFYPSWKSGIFPWLKTTWQKGRPAVTGCPYPAALQWNGNVATLCLPPGWPAEMMGCICKTAQLRRLSTSTRARQHQDTETIEGSSLFRLHGNHRQIGSNDNRSVPPDDLAPSVWSHRENKQRHVRRKWCFCEMWTGKSQATRRQPS